MLFRINSQVVSVWRWFDQEKVESEHLHITSVLTHNTLYWPIILTLHMVTIQTYLCITIAWDVEIKFVAGVWKDSF